MYDGDDVLIDTDAGGAVLAEYTYWPGADRPHSLRKREKSDSVFYYLVDHPGNVVGLVNASNQVVASYRYGPFGLGLEKTGTLIQPLTYLGARGDVSDAEGGLLLLYYVRNRVYDAWQQRFLSEDPIGLAGGINPYTFAGNSPSNHRDPSGLFLRGVFDAIGDAFEGITDVGEAVVDVATDYWGPALGLGAMLVGGAPVVGALQAIGAAGLGSAAAAGVETLLSGNSFGSAFRRNFNFAGAGLAFSAASAVAVGGGIESVGANGLLQGYVQSANPILPSGASGITFGSGTGFFGAPLNTPVSQIFGTTGAGVAGTFAAHELGRTLQFIGLQAIGNPWLSYGAYASLGIASSLGGPGSAFWGFDQQASALGRAFSR